MNNQTSNQDVQTNEIDDLYKSLQAAEREAKELTDDHLEKLDKLADLVQSSNISKPVKPHQEIVKELERVRNLAEKLAIRETDDQLKFTSWNVRLATAFLLGALVPSLVAIIAASLRH